MPWLHEGTLLDSQEGEHLCTLKFRFGRLHTVSFNTEGHILSADQTVVALCQLCLENTVILSANLLKLIILERNVDRTGT